LAACCALFLISFCGGTSLIFRKMGRKGTPNLLARREAKLAINSGLRKEGTAVTQVGKG
jgi:hypothetical protein